MPWSKYCCACGDEVVTARWKLPRPSKSCAPWAQSATVAGSCGMECVSGGVSAQAPLIPHSRHASTPVICPRIACASRRSVVVLGAGRALHGAEAAALECQPLEQRCRPPASAVRRREPPHGLDHARKTRLLAPEHRATLVSGKAVAVHVHHIDVRGADRDPFLENACAFVDEWVQQAFENLLIWNRAPADAELARDLLDEGGYLRIDDARTPLVAVETLAALLPQPAAGHDALEDRRPALIRRQLAALANEEAHIVAGQIAHGERPHGKAECLHHPVDLFGRGALLQQELRLTAVEHEHAVADEAIAVAGEHRNLAERPAERHHGGDRLCRAMPPAHVLEELHDIRRAEEVRADHLVGAGGARSDHVDVESRGVGRENRARSSHLVELGKYPALRCEVFEHRFDDDVRLAQRLIVAHAADQPERLIRTCLREAAPLDGGTIVRADHPESALERLRRDLEQRDRNARVREVHGDATAHRPAPITAALRTGSGSVSAGGPG